MFVGGSEGGLTFFDASKGVSVAFLSLIVVLLAVNLMVLFSTDCTCSCRGCNGDCHFVSHRTVFTITNITVVLFISGIGCRFCHGFT